MNVGKIGPITRSGDRCVARLPSIPMGNEPVASPLTGEGRLPHVHAQVVSYSLCVSASALSALVLACGAAPGTEDAEATGQAITPTSPVCDPPGRAPTGHHWDSSLCEFVPNCVDNVDCKTTAHWDRRRASCQANCFGTVLCKAPGHWAANVLSPAWSDSLRGR